jgi:hypothetical protein
MKCFSLPTSFRSFRSRWHTTAQSHRYTYYSNLCYRSNSKKYNGDWNIPNLQQFYETTTCIPITKYEDTLSLSKWDVLVDTLDTDWLRSLSLCTYSSSGSESDVREGTSSWGKKILYYTGTTWLIAQQHSTISTKRNTQYLRDHALRIPKSKSTEIRICFKVLFCYRGGTLEYSSHCMVTTELAQLTELFCQL